MHVYVLFCAFRNILLRKGYKGLAPVTANGISSCVCGIPVKVKGSLLLTTFLSVSFSAFAFAPGWVSPWAFPVTAEEPGPLFISLPQGSLAPGPLLSTHVLVGPWGQVGT